MPFFKYPLSKDSVTFKGLLKLASTVHIFIGVIFWYFIIILLDTLSHDEVRSSNSTLPSSINTKIKLNISTHSSSHQFNNNSPHESPSTWLSILYFIYLFLFLPIGYLIRRGIKKVPVSILNNYQNYAYFVQKEERPKKSKKNQIVMNGTLPHLKTTTTTTTHYHHYEKVRNY